MCAPIGGGQSGLLPEMKLPWQLGEAEAQPDLLLYTDVAKPAPCRRCGVDLQLLSAATGRNRKTWT